MSLSVRHFLPAAALLPLLLAGCVSAPQPLQGQFAVLSPKQAVEQQAAGEHVRWGGRVVQVDPQAARSCFKIIAFALDGAGRPLKRDQSEGRFIACREGFFDPEVFQAGREVTVAGTIEGFETRKVGEYDYRYARVSADVVYLWPERKDPPEIIMHPQPFFWHWYW